MKKLITKKINTACQVELNVYEKNNIYICNHRSSKYFIELKIQHFKISIKIHNDKHIYGDIPEKWSQRPRKIVSL